MPSMFTRLGSSFLSTRRFVMLFNVGVSGLDRAIATFLSRDAGKGLR